MLQNPIYRGEIVHKEKRCPGRYEPIIDEALWARVQMLLADNRVERKAGAKAAEPSLLAGLLFDRAGERMTPTHANKKRTRYRYYVSQSLIKRGRPGAADAGRRIPAGDIEELVEGRIRAFLGDEAAVFDAIEPAIKDVNERKAVAERAADLAQRWTNLEVSDKRAILLILVAQIEVRGESIDITIQPLRIQDIVDPGLDPKRTLPSVAGSDSTLVLSIPARLKRAGMETKFLIDGPGGNPQREPDRSMLRLLAQTYRFRELMLNAHGRTMLETAAEAGVGRPYFCRIVRLGFLAPEVVRAILRGRQPQDLTAKRLTRRIKLPNAWTEQMALLGFS